MVAIIFLSTVVVNYDIGTIETYISAAEDNNGPKYTRTYRNNELPVARRNF